MQFAIMSESTSDNPQSLAMYFDATDGKSCFMMPTVYDDFATACDVATKFVGSMLNSPRSHHVGEFTVVHNGDIVTTFHVVQLKHTWES